MRNKMNPKLPVDLIEAVCRNTCVAFVGAGLSVGAGMPTWKKLTELMINDGEIRGLISDGDDIRKELENNRIIEVNELVRNQLGPHNYYRLLRNVFAISAEPTKNHELIVDIPFRGIITTNYDKILETSYTLKWRRPPRVMTWTDPSSLGTVLYDNQFFIFKLHGDIDYPESIILTRRDYDSTMYRSPHIRLFLQAIFLTNALLFVGYSINDPDFQMALAEITLLFEGTAPQSFALLPQSESLFSKIYSDRMNIQVIPYDARENHKMVTEILQLLKDKVKNE